MHTMGGAPSTPSTPQRTIAGLKCVECKERRKGAGTRTPGEFSVSRISGTVQAQMLKEHKAIVAASAVGAGTLELEGHHTREVGATTGIYSPGSPAWTCQWMEGVAMDVDGSEFGRWLRVCA